MRSKALHSRAVRPKAGSRRALARYAVLVLAVLTVVAVGAWVAGRARVLVLKVPYLRVEKVQVSGLKYVRREDFIAYMGDPAGISILSVDIDGMLDRARSHPWIKEASIKRELPDTLRIQLRERVPAAVADTGSGRYLVDTEGAALAAVSGAGWEFLPVISFPAAEGARLLEADNIKSIRMALDLLGCVRKDTSEMLSGARISVGDDGSPDILVGGAVVKVGSGGYQEKVRRLGELAHEIEKRDARPVMIDLRFPGKVVVKGGGAQAG